VSALRNASEVLSVVPSSFFNNFVTRWRREQAAARILDPSIESKPRSESDATSGTTIHERATGLSLISEEKGNCCNC
jgi:hypothetical protein